jgi:hypothetical protein
MLDQAKLNRLRALTTPSTLTEENKAHILLWDLPGILPGLLAIATAAPALVEALERIGALNTAGYDADLCQCDKCRAIPRKACDCDGVCSECLARSALAAYEEATK